MSKCFKYDKVCNPRKCNQVCYIKDKKNNVLDIFNSNVLGERQKEVNIMAIDYFQELSNSLLDEVVEYVYNKTKMYPNIEAIRIIRKRIGMINEI